MEKFCDRLQSVASIKKIFQADLARGTGKATSTVSKWWNGEIIPGPKNSREIADFLGCEVTWLTTGQGPMFKYQPQPGDTIAFDFKKEPPKEPEEQPKDTDKNPYASVDPLHMCEVVLNSAGVYSTALASNALAFYTAVKNEEEMNAMREENRETNTRIANLERMMAEQALAMAEQTRTIQQLLAMQCGTVQKRDQKAG